MDESGRLEVGLPGNGGLERPREERLVARFEIVAFDLERRRQQVVVRGPLVVDEQEVRQPLVRLEARVHLGEHRLEILLEAGPWLALARFRQYRNGDRRRHARAEDADLLEMVNAGLLPAIIVDSRQRSTLEADILEPQAAILQAVRRHRRVLDWAESEPSLDAGRVVVFGASLGGFNAFFLSALDERVKAVVPALAAADLPYVFANSTENRIVEAFTNVSEELDISGEALESRMRERLDTDLREQRPAPGILPRQQLPGAVR